MIVRMRTTNRTLYELIRLSEWSIESATRDDGSVIWYGVQDLTFEFDASPRPGVFPSVFGRGGATAATFPSLKITSPNGNSVWYEGGRDGWRTNNRRTLGDMAAASLGTSMDVVSLIEDVCSAMCETMEGVSESINAAVLDLEQKQRAAADAVVDLQAAVQEKIPRAMRDAVRSAMEEYTRPPKPRRTAAQPALQGVPADIASLNGRLFDVEGDEASYVYFLLRRGRVVYVGETCVTVESRVKQHRKDKEFDRVLAMLVPPATRKRIEDQWIQRLKPEYNRTVRGGGEAECSTTPTALPPCTPSPGSA